MSSKLIVIPLRGCAWHSGELCGLAGQAVTNTGPTTIVGNLGVSPGLAISGFPPGMVTGGVIHAGDAVALQAQQDVTTLYNELAGEVCDSNLSGQDLGGLTLTPGVYCFSSSAQLTGALTLDAQGNPNAVFIFQIGSTLTTASNASVLTINGATGCNAFWQVGSSATLGTTTSFVGTIVALTSISLTTGANVYGRVLARNGAVTMDTNDIELGSCTTTGGDAGPSEDASPQVCLPLCGDEFVDLQTDRNNCGACGESCSWDSKCEAGVCTCSETVCGDICVKLQKNPENCGACGNECDANSWCDQGTCTEVCSGTICDGWCTDLNNNHGACGACGNACGAEEVCNSGVCECAGTSCDQACVDLDSSADNCGSCGNACAEGECCQNGECSP